MTLSNEDLVKRLRVLASSPFVVSVVTTDNAMLEAADALTTSEANLSLAVEEIAEAVLRNASPFETTDGDRIPLTSSSEAASLARTTLQRIRGTP